MNHTKCKLIIAPYSKRFGVSVFHGRELIYFAVITYPPKLEDLLRFQRKTVKKLIRRFVPGKILLKNLTARQLASLRQRQITDCVRLIAGHAKIPVDDVSFEQAKRVLTKNGRTTNRMAFEQVEDRFPELAGIVLHQNRWQREYYTVLLSPIVMGLAFADR